MTALHELQTQFLEALRSGSLDTASRLLARGRLGAMAGLEVYENNYTEGFRKALALEFPVIEQLVGANCFARLARRYQREHPSRSGDLHGVGAAFAAFLTEEYGLTEYAYLPDVARLEWALECVGRRQAQNPADLRTLSHLPAETYGDVRLILQPGSTLIASDFPVVAIWQAHQPAASADLRIDLGQGPEHVLVGRGPRGAEVLPLSRAEYAWLCALERHTSLDEALEAALATDSGFDLTKALYRFFQAGLFVQLTLHPPSEIH